MLVLDALVKKERSYKWVEYFEIITELTGWWLVDLEFYKEILMEGILLCQEIVNVYLDNY